MTSIQSRKIGIIGAGHVGAHAAYALVSQGLVDEIIYIDSDEKKALAQALDISDATVYLRHRASIRVGDYSDLDDALLLIIAAGPLPDITLGQTRLDTLKTTVTILKEVTAKLKQSRFSGIILNISNPADVVTHYLQHTLQWEAGRIFSTGTALDSARLRRVVAEAVGIDQKSVNGYVLGEHGESQVVAWSQLSIGGKNLSDLQRERPMTYGALDLPALAKACRLGGWTILEGKGSTEFGIGAAIAEVVTALLGNEDRILPLSVLLNGEYGQRDVYASVPAVLNSEGIRDVIVLNLSTEEQEQFSRSCRLMRAHYQLALTF